MKEQILNQIKANDELRGGKCGLPLTAFKGDLKDVKRVLNELYKEGKIIVREGINQKLIFAVHHRGQEVTTDKNK